MEDNVTKIFLGDLFRQEFFEVFCYILSVACRWMHSYKWAKQFGKHCYSKSLDSEIGIVLGAKIRGKKFELSAKGKK